MAMDPHFTPEGGYPAVDQQQQLLHPSEFPQVPTSAAHIADQIERGGARIEEALTRFNCRYQSLFFLASWSVIFASVMGVGVSLFRFQVANFINSAFLFVFGCSTMVLDIPGTPRWAGRYRKSIRKHARLLTRLTGKSLWFLYLGCMIIACLWPRKPHTTSGVIPFFAIFLSLFVNCVALLGLFIALRKSLRLERLRKSLLSSYQGNWPEVYRKYAVNDPAHGMQFEEFNRMASDYSQGKLLFDLADLHVVYNALDEHQKSAINEVEFGQWISAGFRDEPELCPCAPNLCMTYL